jgi:hypothetical protein
MRLLRVLVAGLAAALAAPIIYIVVGFVLPLLVSFLWSRARGAGGLGGVVVDSSSVVGVAFIGFVAGSCWRFWKTGRKRP